jgi:hypothetical protein
MPGPRRRIEDRGEEKPVANHRLDGGGDALNSSGSGVDQACMAKRKPKGPKAVPVKSEPTDAEALRASVGQGTLAEHVLDSIASVIGDLEETYAEVAALGKSLRLARDQLAEQEAELETLQPSRTNA